MTKATDLAALADMRTGQLTTVNQDPYFDDLRCAWFVQLWAGERPDADLVARVYGDSIDEARGRANTIIATLRAVSGAREALKTARARTLSFAPENVARQVTIEGIDTALAALDNLENVT